MRAGRAGGLGGGGGDGGGRGNPGRGRERRSRGGGPGGGIWRELERGGRCGGAEGRPREWGCGGPGANPGGGAETAGRHWGRGGNPSAASADPAPGPLTCVPGRITPPQAARRCSSRERGRGGGVEERGKGRRPRVQKPLLDGRVGFRGAGLEGAGMIERETREGKGGRETDAAGAPEPAKQGSRGRSRGPRGLTDPPRRPLPALCALSLKGTLTDPPEPPKQTPLEPASSLCPPRPLPPAGSIWVYLKPFW